MKTPFLKLISKVVILGGLIVGVAQAQPYLEVWVPLNGEEVEDKYEKNKDKYKVSTPSEFAEFMFRTEEPEALKIKSIDNGWKIDRGVFEKKKELSYYLIDWDLDFVTIRSPDSLYPLTGWHLESDIVSHMRNTGVSLDQSIDVRYDSYHQRYWLRTFLSLDGELFSKPVGLSFTRPENATQFERQMQADGGVELMFNGGRVEAWWPSLGIHAPQELVNKIRNGPNGPVTFEVRGGQLEWWSGLRYRMSEDLIENLNKVADGEVEGSIRIGRSEYELQLNNGTLAIAQSNRAATLPPFIIRQSDRIDFQVLTANHNNAFEFSVARPDFLSPEFPASVIQEIGLNELQFGLRYRSPVTGQWSSFARPRGNQNQDDYREYFEGRVTRVQDQTQQNSESLITVTPEDGELYVFLFAAGRYTWAQWKDGDLATQLLAFADLRDRLGNENDLVEEFRDLNCHALVRARRRTAIGLFGTRAIREVDFVGNFGALHTYWRDALRDADRVPFPSWDSLTSAIQQLTQEWQTFQEYQREGNPVHLVVVTTMRGYRDHALVPPPEYLTDSAPEGWDAMTNQFSSIRHVVIRDPQTPPLKQFVNQDAVQTSFRRSDAAVSLQEVLRQIFQPDEN